MEMLHGTLVIGGLGLELPHAGPQAVLCLSRSLDICATPGLCLTRTATQAHNAIHDDDDDDIRGAAELASLHAGDSGDASLFSSILKVINQKKQELDKDDIDETSMLARLNGKAYLPPSSWRVIRLTGDRETFAQRR
jgi:hypothetical protein